MTATEIFKLFLRKGVTPNERLALMTEIRKNVRNKDNVYLWRQRYWNEPLKEIHEIETSFAERVMYNSHYVDNHLGRYGESSGCTSLSSLMRYLLYYMQSIIGTARKKNRFLGREEVEIPEKMGYKRYWESRFIKKWHEFLKENVRNYDSYVAPWGFTYDRWMLKNQIKS